MGKTYLLCIALAFLVHCSVAVSLTNNTDQNALLTFKACITLDPHNILISNWSTTTSYCNWVGISCNPHHRRVIALSLPNMDLRGTIPPQLGNLSFLVIFNIENNSFHGQLPDEMGRLRRLKLVNLRYNQFTGRIPASIGALPELRRLILSFNNFTGEIPPSLFNFSTLEWLGLSGNHLHENIPKEIGNLAALQQVGLANNHFSGEIPSSLSRCRNLRSMYRSSNNFIGNIPPEIGNLSMLVELTLDDNSLTGKGRRLRSLNRQEECKKCHDMGRAGAEGDATPIPEGKEAVNSREYREPVRPSHSSSPGHSDEGKGSGKPPL